MAGFRDAARVIVREDDRSRVVPERAFDDFARVDAGLRQGASEQFLGLNYPMLRVERDYNERLMLIIAEMQAEIIANCGRRAERGLVFRPLLKHRERGGHDLV